MMQYKTRGTKRGSSVVGKAWDLRLYVAGETPRSLRAFQNLRKICEEHLAGDYIIEVVDVMKSPKLAALDQVVAVPTLIRKVPGASPRRMIGDLSNTEKVLAGLEVRN